MSRLFWVVTLAALACGCANWTVPPSPPFDGRLSEIFPKSLELGSWRQSHLPRRDLALAVTVSSAGELVDRKLPRPVAAFVARYYLKGSPEKKIEVTVAAFQHDDHAFAVLGDIVGQPRREPIPIGAVSYRFGDRLVTWKGRYVIGLDASKLDEADRRATLVAFARHIADRIPGDNVPTGTILLLPREDLQITRSSWRPDRVFGRKYLGPGLEAHYEVQTKEGEGLKTRSGRVIVAPQRSAAAAHKALRMLQAEFAQSGQPVEALSSKYAGFLASKPGGKAVLAAVLGAHVVLIDGDLPEWKRNEIFKRLRDQLVGAAHP